MLDMAESIVSHGCSSVIILGDVFHKRGSINVESLQAFSDFLYALVKNGLEVRILVGNHDMARSHQNSNALNCFDVWQNVYVYSSVVIDKIHSSRDETAMYIPYQESHSAIETLLNSVDVSQNSVRFKYIFGHFGVKNAKLINTDFKINDGVDLTKYSFDNLVAIVLGHYHTPQKLECNAPAYYVGSPMHHTFNDEGIQKHYMIVDLDEETQRPVSTDYLEFVTIEVSSANELLNAVKSPGFYRVALKNFSIDSDTAREVSEFAYPGGVEYILQKQEVHEVSNFKKDFRIETIIKKYLLSLPETDRRSLYFKIKELIANES
jgi:DNA repair exonuclease SbcCD nuclease subunit